MSDACPPMYEVTRKKNASQFVGFRKKRYKKTVSVVPMGYHDKRKQCAPSLEDDHKMCEV